MKNPKVSVLMPVYNQNIKYLRQAIDGILNQTFAEFEFVIVDDGSTFADCKKVLEEYAQSDSRIRLIKNPENLGLSKTRNVALEAAQGEFVAVQDSDDISDKFRLEKQVAFLEKNPEVFLVGSSSVVIDEKGEVKYFFETFEDDYILRIALAFHNNFTHGSVMMRKAAVWKVEGYSDWATVAEDYDLYVKLLKEGRVANTPEFLYRWRENLKGVSSRNKQGIVKMGNMVTEKYKKRIDLISLASPENWKKNWKENYTGKKISPRLKKRFAKLNFELALYFFQKGKIGYTFFYLTNAIKIFPAVFVLRDIISKKKL
jgi:glycosyltransferase involved in cell wall biosynthesis